MNNKKLIQIIAIAVASLWIFCIVWVISDKVMRKRTAEGDTTLPIGTSQGITETSPKSTTAPYSEPAITIDGNHAVTAASELDKPQWVLDEEASKKAVEESKAAAEKKESEKKEQLSMLPKNKEDIIDAYISAVNKLKNTENFTLKKNENMGIEIDKVTGGNTVKSLADSIINSKKRDGENSYTFSGGMDYRSGKTPNNVIAPINKTASLDKKYVKKAQASLLSGGAYKIRIDLNNATQTLTSPAAGYDTCIEVIDIESLGIPSNIKLESVEINYKNSYIEAIINKDGSITSMKHYVEVASSKSSGKMLLGTVNAEIEMHGSYSVEYTALY